MTIDETLNLMAQQQYPHKVDVVDRVMAQVENKPYLRPVRKHVSWQRLSAVAAAAAVVLVAVNVTVFNLRGYDEDGMGSMIAQLNDYSQWNTVEEAAVNPYEYLFEE